MQDELQQLTKRYAPKRIKNSFYMNAPDMKKPYGSPYILGDFTNTTYHFDVISHKIICTEK